MTENLPEPLPDDESRINKALVAFTACIGEALDDVCSYSLTLGDSYVPFEPDEDSDCDEDDAECSQAWVRVMNTAVSAISPSTWEGDQIDSIVLTLNIEVGVLRCTPVVEKGRAPSETQVLSDALQSMDDMAAILCAALGCEVWNSIDVGAWSPYGPMGGQYGGTWTFTVEI